jgi:hypothetical protein
MITHKVLVPLGAGGLVLGAVGVAAAAGSSPSTASATVAASPTASERGLLRRVEHGRFVVTGKQGRAETLDVQRGIVTAAGPGSLTVRSADGTTATYGITTQTRLRQRGAGVLAASALHAGESSYVLASVLPTGDVARAIVVSG